MHGKTTIKTDKNIYFLLLIIIKYTLLENLNLQFLKEKIFMIIMILYKNCGVPLHTCTLNVPPCGEPWPEDGFVKTVTCSQETNALALCQEGINSFIDC
jgi:hypothetical protein